MVDSHELQLLRQVGEKELLQLEGLLILIPDVIRVSNALEVVRQMQQLFIVRVYAGRVVRNYRNAIVQLQAERVHRVVHDDTMLQVYLVDYTQVLYMHALLRTIAVVSVEAHVDKLLLGLHLLQGGWPARVLLPFLSCQIVYLAELLFQRVNHDVSIALVTCREHDYLVHLPGLLKAVVGVRPYVETGLDHFGAVAHFYRQIELFCGVFNAVNECFI